MKIGKEPSTDVNIESVEGISAPQGLTVIQGTHFNAKHLILTFEVYKVLILANFPQPSFSSLHFRFCMVWTFSSRGDSFEEMHATFGYTSVKKFEYSLDDG